MRTNQKENKNNSNPEFRSDYSYMQAMVKWVEGGTNYRGVVTEVFVKNGAKQLRVMTIFGKRRTVNMSKVKIVKTINRFNEAEVYL